VLNLIVGTALAQLIGPAATINGVPISREKVHAQVNHLINQRGMSSGGITQPSVYKQMQTEVAEQLIVQELLWQEAQRRGFVAEDEVIDARLQEMKSGFDREVDFLFRIEEGGFTEESYRENIKQQISVRRMVSEGMAEETAVTDEEIENFYNSNIDRRRD
jgi:hypothetical protein